jgi:hypothetical protein
LNKTRTYVQNPNNVREFRFDLNGTFNENIANQYPTLYKYNQSSFLPELSATKVVTN